MIIKKAFLLTFLCAFISAMSFSVQAQEMKIAVVDVEKILNESAAGKSIQSQLKKRRETFQKEFKAKEDQLMQAEKKLVQQKSDLNAEDFAKKRKEFEGKLLETRNLFQKRRSSLDKGLGKALTDLRKNIIKVTAEVADEGKYQIVLTRDSVVIVEKNIDITDKVLSRLNKKVPNIKLDIAG